MTLLFKQSVETNKEALCVKLGSDRGIMREVTMALLITCSFCPGEYVLFETAPQPRDMRACVHQYACMRACDACIDMHACAPVISRAFCRSTCAALRACASARACCTLITYSFCPGDYVLFENAPPPRDMRACLH